MTNWYRYDTEARVDTPVLTAPRGKAARRAVAKCAQERRFAVVAFRRWQPARALPARYATEQEAIEQAAMLNEHNPLDGPVVHFGVRPVSHDGRWRGGEGRW